MDKAMVSCKHFACLLGRTHVCVCVCVCVCIHAICVCVYIRAAVCACERERACVCVCVCVCVPVCVRSCALLPTVHACVRMRVGASQAGRELPIDAYTTLHIPHQNRQLRSGEPSTLRLYQYCDV